MTNIRQRLVLGDFQGNWQYAKRTYPDSKVRHVAIIAHGGGNELEVFTGRRTNPALVVHFPLGMIILAQETELPSSPLLWLKAKRFPIIDGFAVSLSPGEFRDMVFIKAELPA